VTRSIVQPRARETHGARVPPSSARISLVVSPMQRSNTGASPCDVTPQVLLTPAGCSLGQISTAGARVQRGCDCWRRCIATISRPRRGTSRSWQARFEAFSRLGLVTDCHALLQEAKRGTRELCRRHDTCRKKLGPLSHDHFLHKCDCGPWLRLEVSLLCARSLRLRIAHAR
jgi:hypothetical protein